MEVSVAQAADAMKVSPRRMRQLIASGRVRARQLGPLWLVDGASLPTAPRRSRPMSPSVAWAFLSSDAAPAVHRGRWLERRARLAADPKPEQLLASWAAARAGRMLYTSREPAGVLDDPRVIRSGLSDPRAGISAVDVAEGYVTTADLEQVRRAHLLRSAPGRPTVILHVVNELPPDPVPLLLLAADLAEHDGARELARSRALITGALDS